MINLLFNKAFDLEPKISKFTEESFFNVPTAFIITFFSMFSVIQIMKITQHFWKKGQKLNSILLFLFGIFSFIVVKILLLFFNKWIKAQVNSSNSEPFILFIKPLENIKNKTEFLNTYLTESMFFSESNKKSIIELFERVNFSQEQNVNLKILISGCPGVGKTHVITKIGSLMPNGAIILKLSALLQYDNFNDVDMNQEINRVDDLIEECIKQKLVLIIDDAELLLTQRSENKKVRNEYQPSNQHLISNIIGIWSNHWLSMISAQKLTIIIASNVMHTVKNSIDQANARRINDHFIFHLPNKEERKGIFKKYLSDYLIVEDIVDNSENAINTFAELTEGFSGRHIKKICLKLILSSKIVFCKDIYSEDVINEIKILDNIIKEQEDKQREEKNIIFFEKIKQNWTVRLQKNKKK